MILRKLFVFICSGAGVIAASGEGARANDFPAGKAQVSRANAQCAAYGPGFTAVQGSDTCVWVGGHVRVEIGSRGSTSPDSGWAAGSAAPAAMRANESYIQPDFVRAVPARAERSISRDHLRLRDGDVTGSIEPLSR